jgi:transposase
MKPQSLPENMAFILDTSEPLPGKPPKWTSAAVLWQVILYLVTLLRQVKTEVANLQAEVRLQRAKRFGTASEKQGAAFLPSKETLQADVELTEGLSADAQPSAPTKRKAGAQPGHRGTGRHIPRNLEQSTKIVELPKNEQYCPKCGLPYRETTLTEDSFEVDIQLQVRLVCYQRKRYERQCACDGTRLITAPVPAKLIPKGKFSVHSWVKFLLDKYYANVPLGRQIASLQFMGLPVCKGTLIGGFKHLKTYLEPLYEYFMSRLRTATRLHADETRWRVFAEVEGKTGHRWWLWVFLSDEVVAYVLDPHRSTAAARKALSTAISDQEAAALSQQAYPKDTPAPVIFWIDGQAYLLSPNLNTISADRYIVYQLIDVHILVAFCWAHVRRDFVDFEKAHPNQPALVAWAQSWIEEIAQVYQINDQRLNARSQPELFAQIQSRLETTLAKMKNRYDKLDGLTLITGQV